MTNVILIPSTRDVHHQPVYPQPALKLPESFAEHPANPFLHVANNPAGFTIGGVRVGACAVDTLFMLGQQELARNPPPPKAGQEAPKPDRMARLASHVLQQRQLLPLFPVPSDERNPLAVDVTANLKAGMLSTLPDVLLMPSELAPFAKLCHAGVLAVNPGRLTRKAAGGNFAQICIHAPPPPKPVVDADEEPKVKNPLMWMDADGDAEESMAAAADGEAKEEKEKEKEKEEGPDLIMEAALAVTSGGAVATPAAASADASSSSPADGAAAASGAAASSSSGKPEEEKPKSGVIAAPDDAPNKLEKRAFVEVKRI